MPKRLLGLCVIAALALSCQKFAEGRQLFHDLLVLRDQITTEFHEKVVDVSIINGNQMAVKFVNSPYNDKSDAEKQARANVVADFVVKHYKTPLKAVIVQYVAEKGVAGFSMSHANSYVVPVTSTH